MQGHLCENRVLCPLGAFTTNIRWYFNGSNKNSDLLLQQFLKHQWRVGRGRRTDGQIGRQADRE